MPRDKRLTVRSVRHHERMQYLLDLRAFGGSRLCFDTLEEAHAKLCESDLRHALGTQHARRARARDATVSHVAARFLHAREALAGPTYPRYGSDLEAHILPRFGAWRWPELDRETATTFLQELKESPIVRRRRGFDGRPVLVAVPGTRRSDTTVRGVLATLSALASYAVD